MVSSDTVVSTDGRRVPIKPITPPLSVSDQALPRTPGLFAGRLDRRTGLLLLALGGILVISSGLILYLASINPPSSIQPTQSAAPSDEVPVGDRQETTLPPLAALTQQQAEAAAQEALAAYVKAEQTLTGLVNLEFYVEADLPMARELALQGDAFYVEENYREAAAGYFDAQQIVVQMIEAAEERLLSAERDIRDAVDAFNVDAAVSALTTAKQLSGPARSLEALTQRVETLPTVLTLLREAKNHELSERYAEALAVYRRVQGLDPETVNIASLIATTEQARARQRLRETLGMAILALEEARFTEAETYFNAALKIDAASDVALAGLEQITQSRDIRNLKEKQRAAEEALAQEQWASAIDTYEDVLETFAYITFAIDGLAAAQERQRLQSQLEKIISQPEKLSNQNLLAQGRRIAEQAKTLLTSDERLRGGNFEDLTYQADTILTQYGNVVRVTLTSDNATEITASNIGALGQFNRLVLDLRVGQYTFRGVQAGCRDIYRSVVITPGITPIDLSCQERLSP